MRVLIGLWGPLSSLVNLHFQDTLLSEEVRMAVPTMSQAPGEDIDAKNLYVLTSGIPLRNVLRV
jgi:hypothetical protein